MPSTMFACSVSSASTLTGWRGGGVAPVRAAAAAARLAPRPAGRRTPRRTSRTTSPCVDVAGDRHHHPSGGVAAAVVAVDLRGGTAR